MTKTELDKIENKWVHDPVFLVIDVEKLVNEIKRLRTGIEECAQLADKWTFPGSSQDTQPPIPESWAARLRSLLDG